MQLISICVLVICLCVIVHDANSNTVDSETPQWKIDINRMVLQSNEILTPNTNTKNNVSHFERRHEKNRMAPRYRYRNNKKELYYPKPLHKNKHKQKYRQRINSQPNISGRLLNPNEYPPNWNGGYYKYHQEGHAVVPHIGASVNVPITRGNFQAHRSKIITTVIKPDEWKNANLIEKQSFETPKQSHYRQHDPKCTNVDPRIHKRTIKGHCVICPEERTLITNKKRDKVLFKAPKLKSCLGCPLNSKYTFKSIYGAKPNTLLSPGTHVMVGEIHYLKKSLQICHLRVNVIAKQCEKFDIPPHLKMICDAENNWGSECQFQCANPSHAIDGNNGIFCNDDLNWVGNIPNCTKKTNSCDYPITDLHVNLLCNTSDENSNTLDNDAENGSKLPEGTQCRVECDPGYRTTPRSSSAVCVQGEWQGNLSVSCRRNRRKAQRSLKRRSMKRRKNPFLHSDRI